MGNINYFDKYNTFVNDNRYELDYDKIIINNKKIVKNCTKFALRGFFPENYGV